MGDIDEIRAALLSGNGRLALVPTFTHGMGVQVYLKTRKIGPLLLPNDGETVSDVLNTIGGIIR